MGSGCSRCRCCCCCPKEKRDQHVQAVSARASKSSPVQKKSVGTDPMRSNQEFKFVFTSYQSVNMDEYKYMFDEVNFDDILNDIDTIVSETFKAELSSLNKSDKKQEFTKEPFDYKWKEQYFAHGDSSNVVTEVDSEVHACIKSVESKSINIKSRILKQITIKMEQHIQDRIQLVSQREDAARQRYIKVTKDITKIILNNGNSYRQNYEKEYRQFLEAYIAQLEKAMVNYLDDLHNRIKIDQQTLILRSDQYIENLTYKALTVRKTLLEKIYLHVNQRVKQFFVTSREVSLNMASQPLGREELRTINLRIYSNVGEDIPGQACDNTPDRNKFIKEINDKKPQHQYKRTVYLGSNPNVTIPKSDNGS